MLNPDFLPIPGLEEPEVVVTTTVERASVEARLHELGLVYADFEEALNEGQNGARRVTASHAKTAAGTYRWNETLAAFRNNLIAKGWIQTDEKNAPRIVSPDGSISIIVATGNEKTGTKMIPSNATTKGIMTQQDVWNNGWSEQQAIEEVEEMIARSTPETWVLLYFYSKKFNHIRAELSRPKPHEMKNGFISEWDERIILPKIDLNGTELLSDAQADNTETQDVEFTIGDAEAV